jgi:hypothetical protein
VAESLLCSPSKVSRLETGHRGASPRDIRDLCELYGVTDPSQRERLEALAREGRTQAWWQPLDLPYATYVGLEAEAISIRDFEPGVVPGLLQTADYARAVHRAVVPPLDEEVIDQRVTERQSRQMILNRDKPPELRVIMDESVIHRIVGGPGVMAAQLERVVEVAGLPDVTLQTLPFSAGAHPALESTFIMLGFPEPLADVVYAEGLVGYLYLDRPHDIERYGRVFEYLCDIALSPEQSVQLITEKIAEYRSQSLKTSPVP